MGGGSGSGSGEKHNMANLYHLLHHHHSHKNNKEEMKLEVRKGYMAVMVGNEEEEEELQRFVIPIMYVNHPLFINLLKEAEKEYGFKHKGPITIPCNVDEFKRVQGLIDQDQNNRRHHHHNHSLNHNHNHNHHNFLCFKA